MTTAVCTQVPPRKLNCWEVMKCGRAPGGPQCVRLGACPAATDSSVDGFNGGHNGGRLCWAVAGTFCGGRVRTCVAGGTHGSCLGCSFFDAVLAEEGDSAAMTRPDQTEWLARP